MVVVLLLPDVAAKTSCRMLLSKVQLLLLLLLLVLLEEHQLLRVDQTGGRDGRLLLLHGRDVVLHGLHPHLMLLLLQQQQLVRGRLGSRDRQHPTAGRNHAQRRNGADAAELLLLVLTGRGSPETFSVLAALADFQFRHGHLSGDGVRVSPVGDVLLHNRGGGVGVGEHRRVGSSRLLLQSLRHNVALLSASEPLFLLLQLALDERILKDLE